MNMAVHRTNYSAAGLQASDDETEGPDMAARKRLFNNMPFIFFIGIDGYEKCH
jgi:hypothetical protein